MIWDGDDELSPVATFPTGDLGWREAGLMFNSLETPLLSREEPPEPELVPPRRSWLFKAVVGLGAIALGGIALSTLIVKRPPRGIIFRDDFSNPAGGWPIYPWPDGRADYYQETYRIRFLNPTTLISPRFPLGVRVPALELDIDATIIPAAGTKVGQVGMACMVGGDDAYVMVIEPDEDGPANARFQTMVELQIVDIWRAHFDSVKAGASNHIHATCRSYSDGSVQLTLSVNGMTLSTQADPLPIDSPEGFIGVALIAGTDVGGTEASFDNAVLQVPSDPG